MMPWGWLRGPCLAACLCMMGSTANALEPVSFQSIEGWKADNLVEALQPFRESCREVLSGSWAFDRSVRYGGHQDQWREICSAAEKDLDPRTFFETWFRPYRVVDAAGGLFTGYFEPQVEASLHPDNRFSIPIYRKPADLVAFELAGKRALGMDYGRLVNGQPQLYYSRKEIENGALSGRGLELAYVATWADAFFMQIQGAGRLHLKDGSVLRLGYAAKSGRPYTSIGSLLAEAGVIPREKLSMQRIRLWMEENPEAARHLMWRNESFVFFRKLEISSPELGPIGAGRVHLTPERSLAVDRSIWMFGTPVWLDTQTPVQDGLGSSRFRKLMIAQDTGSAIRGMARGDVFWGHGPDAAYAAGHMKSSGLMIVLLPNRLADDLGLPP